MEYVTTAEYYAEAEALMKQYLEAGSKEWKAAMLDRKRYEDGLTEERLKALEEAEKERQRLYSEGADDAKLPSRLRSRSATQASSRTP
jgi:hypothetical protein